MEQKNCGSTKVVGSVCLCWLVLRETDRSEPVKKKSRVEVKRVPFSEPLPSLEEIIRACVRAFAVIRKL